MNRMTINGKTITCSGTNVVVNNGRIIVDGKTIQECNSCLLYTSPSPRDCS